MLAATVSSIEEEDQKMAQLQGRATRDSFGSPMKTLCFKFCDLPVDGSTDIYALFIL